VKKSIETPPLWLSSAGNGWILDGPGGGALLYLCRDALRKLFDIDMPRYVSLRLSDEPNRESIAMRLCWSGGFLWYRVVDRESP